MARRPVREAGPVHRFADHVLQRGEEVAVKVLKAVAHRCEQVASLCVEGCTLP